jgi:hypothetical protein
MDKTRRTLLAGLTATIGEAAIPGSLLAQTSDYDRPSNYTFDEIVAAGHSFFGKLSEGLAQSIEYLFSSRGHPNGYVLGEEGSGAFIAGLRYGEGTLSTKNVGQHKLYWQGPSIGWDVGGDGARTMMLIYNLPDVDAAYRYFAGVNGSAYLVAGFGVSLYSNDDIYLAPIRTGLGARLGVNLGYLKMTRQATWNPF